jgi:uncharacterized repeat protein (TIGR01451 family)
MMINKLLSVLILFLGLVLCVALFVPATQTTSFAQLPLMPGNPVLDPPRNSHTAPLTITISITYDEPISATTVTSRTFVVHAMQSGMLTGTHSVSDGAIIVTPTRPLHQGELVHVVATTRTLGLDGTEPLSSTQWQFRAGQVATRCVVGFTDIHAGLTGVYRSSIVWGDYDNDGDLDILLTGRDGGWNPVSRVYRNDGPSGSGWTFTHIGAGLVDVWGGSAMWGDYDNDGDLDILLTGYTDDIRVSKVYRNDDGNFTDINAGLTGVNGSAAVWGDYDNDGDLDILLTGRDDDANRVSKVYRNEGLASGWTFTDINAELTGVISSAAAWGDYDNDGDLDFLLAGNYYGGSVSRVYRNNGPTSGWTFTNVGAGLTGVEGGSVAWGDYDNDGDLDILLTGHTGLARVTRLYRNDDGSFSNVATDLTDVGYGAAVWGDYDNDGDLDILLTGFTGPGSGTPTARVFRNDGPPGWTFTDIGAGLEDLGNGSVAWGDYDNDGDLDILLTGEDSSEAYVPTSRIYRNDDCIAGLVITKTVTPRVALPGETITYTLAFSNAGPLVATDVFITDSVPSGVTISRIVSKGVAISNTGTLQIYAWRVQDLAPSRGGIITLTAQISAALSEGTILTNKATISGDTWDTDLANNTDEASVAVGRSPTAHWLHPPRNIHTAPLTTSISITYDDPMSATTVSSRTFVVHAMQSGMLAGIHGVNEGTIVVTPTQPFHQGELVYVIATTRTLNVTGTAPLRATQWQFRTAVESGSGRFVNKLQSQIQPISTTVDVALGDLDGDGDLDAFAANQIYPDQVWLNDGKGNFEDSGQELGGADSGGVALGDLDGDGDLDAFVANAWPRANTVWLNDGAGTFVNSGQELGGSYSWDVALGDVDGDGDLDAFVANGYWPGGQPNKVWLNDGTGAFRDSGQDLGSADSEGVALGDLDSDGDLDAFVANAQNNQANTVWLNDGRGTFIDSGQSLGSSYSWDVALGDLDGDGDLDAFVANGYVNQPDKVWLNDGTGSFDDSGQDLGDSYSFGVALGDLDGDGDLDAFVVTSLDQANQIWLNDGAGSFERGQSLDNATSLQVVLEDVDGDRDLDACVASRNPQTEMLWLNQNQADLAIAKTVTSDIAAPGEAITYTLVFTNNGPQAATGIFINDSIPISVTALSDQWSVVSGQITRTPGITYEWTLSDLAPGQGGIITITGRLSDTLPHGHVFTNTATITGTVVDDVPGNDSDARDITIDAEAPEPPTLLNPADGAVVSDASPTLAWAASPSPDVAGYLLDFDGNVMDMGDVTQYTTMPVLANGFYTWTVAAYDGANNTSVYTDTWSFEVDATPPEPPTLLNPVNGTVTSTTNLDLAWTASLSLEVAGYWLDFDGSVMDLGNVTTYNTGVLADGVYTWTVAAYDAWDNISAYTNVWGFEIDSAAPNTTITSNPPNPSSSADATFEFSSDDGDGSGLAFFECRLDGSGWNTCTSPQNYVGLDNGSHTFEVRATDDAGNTDPTPATYAWNIEGNFCIYLPLVLRNQ